MTTIILQPQSEIQHEKPVENSIKQASKSMRDWPNEAGFQTLHEERVPVELPTTGSIPSYAAGALYRTGPGSYKVSRGDKEDFICSHWFDGFGHTHRFEIVAQDDGSSKVFYNSRRQNDKLIENVKKAGKYGHITFGQKMDPCIGIFGKVMSVFEGSTKEPQVANISVTIRPNMPGPKSARKEDKMPGHSTGLKSLWSTTDSAQFKEIDPLTLEPIGLASQKSLHPLLKGPMSCAHAQSDPETGDVFNYNMVLGREAVYRVFKTSVKTGQTEILATISGNGIKPAYLHSFFKTEDFVVLCIWNSRYDGTGLKVLLEQNILDAIAPFDSSQSARWLVIDRKQGRGLVAEFESPPSFCFHTVNAWQEVDSKGKLNIVCEYIEYENLDILHSFYYKNMTSEGKDAVNFNSEKGWTSLPRLARYRLSSIGATTLIRTKGRKIPQAELIFHMEKRQVGDLPTINPRFEMQENRYVYSVVNRGHSTFLDGISKGDTVTKSVAFWENEKGHTPGEAIFVPNPEGVEEDDGVLLSVVLDGFKGTSYLLCLDAKTMKEVGRATCEWAIGLGFHGTHVRS